MILSTSRLASAFYRLTFRICKAKDNTMFDRIQIREKANTLLYILLISFGDSICP